MWSPLALISVTALLGANAQVVTAGKCCKTDLNLSNPHYAPYFKGLCWKIDHFEPHGTTYQCGDYGYVMYRPGAEQGNSGITHNAQFLLKKSDSDKSPYVQVILRCDPKDNPGLRKSFIVGEHPFYCTSTVGQNFAQLTSCQHPRISYRLAGNEANIHCI